MDLFGVTRAEHPAPRDCARRAELPGRPLIREREEHQDGAAALADVDLEVAARTTDPECLDRLVLGYRNIQRMRVPVLEDAVDVVALRCETLVVVPRVRDQGAFVFERLGDVRNVAFSELGASEPRELRVESSRARRSRRICRPTLRRACSCRSACEPRFRRSEYHWRGRYDTRSLLARADAPNPRRRCGSRRTARRAPAARSSGPSRARRRRTRASPRCACRARTARYRRGCRRACPSRPSGGGRPAC